MTEDNSEARYRLSETKQNARLSEFRAASDLGSLREEIALARVLLEEKVNSGESSLASLAIARDLLGVLGRLSRAHRFELERSSQSLGKPALQKLVDQIADAFVAEFADVSDSECRLDRAADRIEKLIQGSSND